jgi:hypothetical protein
LKVGKEIKKQGEGRSGGGKKLDGLMEEGKQKKGRMEGFKREKDDRKKRREERKDLKEGSKRAASQAVSCGPRPRL